LPPQFANPLRDYGYPSDYGLPVPSASSGVDVTVNPLTDLLFSEESDIVTTSGRRSTTLSPLRTAHVGHFTSSSVLGDTSAALGETFVRPYQPSPVIIKTPGTAFSKSFKAINTQRDNNKLERLPSQDSNSLV
jgi:hypothetical protein